MKIVIALVCLCGLGAVAGAVIVGTRSFDGTVVEHPYERGLAWDRDRDRKRDSRLDVRLTRTAFTPGPSTASFAIVGEAAAAIGDRDVTVRASRPAAAAYDSEFPARRQPDGSWAAPVRLPLAGRWELIVVIERPEGSIEFPTPVIVAETAASGALLAGTAAVPCDLSRGPCTAVLPGGVGSVTLLIDPRPVRTMRELLFEVRIACGDAPCAAQEVSLALTMPGMYMGENRIRLERSGEGFYRGRGVIVTCPSGRRAWRATVQAAALGAADFTFEADRP
jgi:nitrogen fixation protein FixH